MNQVLSLKNHATQRKAAQRVLYVGPSTDEICNLLVNHIGRIDIAYETEVQAAFAHLRSRQFDVVIIDQRDENLATRLILPVLQSLGYPVKPVVISPLTDIGHYLSVPGVARVLAAPVKETQLLRILGLERRTRPVEDATPTQAETKAATPSQAKPAGLIATLINRCMGTISMLYKRAAFVMLFALFVAFAFYGLLIGFFLLSSGWGAPLTLTRGHEMVNRVEREITEANVALNLTDQRLVDEDLAKSSAEQELRDAKALVKYAAGTVKKEIQNRNRQSKVLSQSVKRLRKVKAQLEKQVSGAGPSADLERLYQKRLIDRASYSASTLNLIEAGQRLAAIDIEIDQSEGKLEELAMSQEMLATFDTAMKKGEGLSGVTATSSDLLPLTNQASQAVAAREMAKSKINSVEASRATLLKSKNVLTEQIATLENSALARARDKRIDVVFVPYGNDNKFRQGASLYSCMFTIILCSKVGEVGQPLPGEINSVHPFFGKPIRGSLVEVKLTAPDAAMREIIHGTRKPLLF
jgi:hypothetical protein